MTSETNYIELTYDRDIAYANTDYYTNRTIYLPFKDYGNGATIEWKDGDVSYIEGVLPSYDGDHNADIKRNAGNWSAGSDIVVRIYGDVRQFTGHQSAYNHNRYYESYVQHSNKALKSVKIVGMSSITNCQYAFSRCFNLTSVDLTQFDSSNVTTMNYMFNSCSKLETLNLSALDVRKVTDFSYTFNGCSALTDLNINNWNTESATNMLAMFNGCSSLPYIAPSTDGNRADAEFTLNTSKVTAMHYMFSGCSSLVKLHPTNWDTSAVTNMSYMFNACSSLTFVDLAEWDVNAISYSTEANNGMYQMFHGCSSLDNDGVNFSKWCVSKFTDEPRNFRTGGTLFVEKPDWGYACENKTPGPISVPPYDYIELTYDRDIAYANTDYYTNRTIYLPFKDYGNGATIEWKDGDVSYIEGVLPSYDGDHNADIKRNAGNWSAGSDIVVRIYGDVRQFTGHQSAYNHNRYYESYVQHSNKALKSVKIVGMSSITNCQYAFSRCFNLTSVDLTEFDSSNVINMSYMFHNCSSIETLDLSHQDVSKVSNFKHIFSNCSSLTDLNITTWQTNSATTMHSMFKSCSSLPYIAPSSDSNRENAEFTLNTTQVIDMQYMFSACSSLVKLHPTNWDTSAVKEMDYMFNGCSSLTFVDLAEWDVNAISYSTEASNGMYQMFHGCSSLDNDGVNFSKWCVSKFTDEPRNFRTGGTLFVEKPDWGYACENKTPGPISVPPYDYIELTYDRDIAYANTDYYTNRTIYLPFKDYGNGATIEWKDGDVSYIEGVLPSYDGDHNADIKRNAGNWSAGSDIVVRIYGDVRQFTGHQSAYNHNRYYESYVQHSNKALKSVKIVGMSSITNCQYAFSRCFNLTSVDLTQFDSSNVTTMNYMFNSCSKLETLNLSALDVRKVTDFSYTFNGCSALTDLNITNWTTISATTFKAMFQNCSSLKHIAPNVV